MAEANKDKLNIKLHVYDENIDVTVKREDEQYYRAAAKLISERYGIYAQRYQGWKKDHTIALMTLVDIALSYEREREKNDTAPYVNVLSQLTAEIENALK